VITSFHNSSSLHDGVVGWWDSGGRIFESGLTGGLRDVRD
jgi:hypothetical protein